MGGKAKGLQYGFVICGITPAYAGSSLAARCFPARPWDHPRVRGEQLHDRYRKGDGIGSPPRARGAVLRWMMVSEEVGITPACAGSSRKHGNG